MTGTRPDTAPTWPRTAGDVWDGPPWLDLVPAAASAGRARMWTRAVLAALELGQLADEAELITSELVTNAMRASSSAGINEPVRICLAAIGAHLLIQVRDSCPASPVRRSADPADEAGRGMTIVGELSAEVGCHPTPAGPGKVVWCLVTGDSSFHARQPHGTKG
jgi:anti-sigma regulatory factor (Ser/Thr protein kinase)